MEALAWWIHDQRCCNREIYAEEFDVEIMEACLNELELESKEEMDRDYVVKIQTYVYLLHSMGG
jgi:hypothetical protein